MRARSPVTYIRKLTSIRQKKEDKDGIFGSLEIPKMQYTGRIGFPKASSESVSYHRNSAYIKDITACLGERF